MAKYIPNFSGSLTLRTLESEWNPPFSGAFVTVTNPNALTWEQMDYNWWNLYSWSFQLDEALEGAAFTGSANTFTQPQVFSGSVDITGNVTAGNPLSIHTFTGGNTTFNSPTQFNLGINVPNGNVRITGSVTASAFAGDGFGLTNLNINGFVSESTFNTFTSSYKVDSASISGRVDTIETTYATKAGVTSSINIATASLQAGVTASINTYSSSIGGVMAANIADLYTGSSVFATIAQLNASSSALKAGASSSYLDLQAGATASYLDLQIGVTASLLSYTLTSSFHTYTASFDTAVSASISTAITGAFTELTQSLINAINYSGSILSTRLDVVTGSTVINSTTSSFLGTASFVPLIAGPGLSVNGMEITASLRSVNGIFPDTTTGNVQVNLVQTLTGTSASLSSALPTGLATGSVWIISNDPTTAFNGDAYVLGSGSSGPEWLPIAPLDQAQADARYLKLDGANGPMQGAVDFGGFGITTLASAGSTLTSATNLADVLAQTASLSAGVTASINAISTSISNYTTLISQSVASEIIDLYTGSALLQATASKFIDFVSGSYHIDSASWNAGINTLNNSLPTYLSSSLTASFLTTASFDTFSSSITNRATTLEVTASTSYISSSISGQVITYNKGNGAIDTITLPTQDLSTYLSSSWTASFTSFTSSVNATTGALELTTGSINAWTSSVVTTSSFATYTASINNWTSSAYTGSVDQFTLTSSFNAFTSSYNTGSWLGNVNGTASWSNNAVTASYITTAQTASYIDVTGSGVLVNWNGSTLQLTASVAAGTPSLQDVTTVGASSTSSLLITGSLFGTSSWSLKSLTASYIDVTGSGVLINWNGSTLQLTGSAASTTPSLEAVLAVGNFTTGSINATGSAIGFVGTASWALNTVTASYVATSSWANNATTASHALTASYYVETQTLQSVLTLGSQASGSVIGITGSFEVTGGYFLPPVITGLPQLTAPYNTAAVPVGAIVYASGFGLYVKKGQLTNWVQII